MFLNATLMVTPISRASSLLPNFFFSFVILIITAFSQRDHSNTLETNVKIVVEQKTDIYL